MNAKILGATIGIITLLAGLSGCVPIPDEAAAAQAKVPAAPAEIKESTPQSCLTALDTADEAFGVVAVAFSEAAKLPDLIVRAAQAGMSMDAAALDGVTEDLSSSTTIFTEQADRLDTLSATYNTNAAACRAGR